MAERVPDRWMSIHGDTWGIAFRPLRADLEETVKAEATPVTDHVHIWSDEDGELHIERIPVSE